MTAIDDYLARERETLRAATPRPWAAPTGPYSEGAVYDDSGGVICAFTACYPSGSIRMDDDDAHAIVSAVNDREVLLDAVELLAVVRTYLLGPLLQRVDAVLSRLTADSEGVTHV